MYPNTAHDIEFEFADRVDAMYANARSFNRWVYEEVGYTYENRLFLPPYIPLADVDLAVKELETVMEQGAPLIQIKGGHAHGGRANPFGGKSVADPELDPDLVARQRGGHRPHRAPRRHRLPEVRRRLVRRPRPHLRRLHRLPVDDVLG